MNVFQTIADIVERQTGYHCVYAQENIEDQQILLDIQAIQQLESAGMFGIRGSLTIKTGVMHGWQVLTTLLQLDVTGTTATASLKPSKEGYVYMSVDFSVVLTEKKGRARGIKSFEWEKEENVR